MGTQDTREAALVPLDHLRRNYSEAMHKLSRQQKLLMVERNLRHWRTLMFLVKLSTQKIIIRLASISDQRARAATASFHLSTTNHR